MLYTQTSTHIIIYTNNIITKNNAHTQYYIHSDTHIIHINNKMLEVQTICQIFLQTAVVVSD